MMIPISAETAPTTVRPRSAVLSRYYVFHAQSQQYALWFRYAALEEVTR